MDGREPAATTFRAPRGRGAASVARVALAGLLLGATNILPLCGPAGAALPLRVLARTSLQLEAGGDAGELAIGGRLLDDLGRGLAGRTVTLALADGQRTELSTDGRGLLPRWIVRLARGKHRLTAAFGGDAQGFAACRAELDLEVQPPAPRLKLSLPARLGPDEPLPASVRATLHRTPLAMLELRFSLDGRPCGTATTDRHGMAHFLLSARTIGQHGLRRLEVASAAGEELAAASSAGSVLRWDVARLTLAAALEQGILEDRLLLSGQLTVAGEGLPGRLLQLRIGPLARTVTTDLQGRYALRLAAEQLPAPPGPAIARFAGEAGLEPTEAGAEIDLPPPRPSLLPRALTVSAAVALLLALGLGGRALLALLRRLRSAAASTAGNGRGEAESGRRPPPLPAWTQLAPSGGAGERSGSLVLCGLLRDRVADLPIVGGTVRLLPGAPTRPESGPVGQGGGPAGDADFCEGQGAHPECLSGADGAFRLEAPQPGAWRLCATAPGYVEAVHPLDLPSAQARGLIRLGLMPVREAVRQIWLEQASQRHPSARPIWGWLTPAQVLACLDRPPASYTLLTRLMEEVYYSAGPPDAVRCDQARALALALAAPPQTRPKAHAGGPCMVAAVAAPATDHSAGQGERR